MSVNEEIHFYIRILTFLFKALPIIATFKVMVTFIPKFLISFMAFLTIIGKKEIIFNHFFCPM